MTLSIPLRVYKQIATMPKNDARRLLERLEKIAESPGTPHPNMTALVGESASFRVRQGDWRAILSVEDGGVILDRVAHRKEVYR